MTQLSLLPTVKIPALRGLDTLRLRLLNKSKPGNQNRSFPLSPLSDERSLRHQNCQLV